MSNIQLFTPPTEVVTQAQVSAVTIDGQPWFIGSEICTLLGYKKPNNALSRHCFPEGTLKRGILTSGGIQEMILINEPNLYALIMKSNLPSARRLLKWVVEDVLPSLRREGTYTVPEAATAPAPRRTPLLVAMYFENQATLPLDYFTAGDVIVKQFYFRLAQHGRRIPDLAPDGKHIRMDISVSMMFNTYIKERYPHLSGQYRTVAFHMPDGRTEPIQAWNNIVYPIFIDFFLNVWLRNHSAKYFDKRDPGVVPYVNGILNTQLQHFIGDVRRHVPSLTMIA